MVLNMVHNFFFPSKYVLQLDYAVKIRSISLTQDRYDDAAIVLQEVMSSMP